MINGIKSINKLQLLGLTIAGVGLFLPLVIVSAMGESARVSFFQAPDGKILLPLIIVAIIFVFLDMFKEKLAFRIISLVLIAISLIVFIVDMSEVSKSIGFYIVSIKRGIGYYMIIFGLGVSTLISVYSLFIRKDRLDDYNTIVVNDKNFYGNQQNSVTNNNGLIESQSVVNNESPMVNNNLNNMVNQEQEVKESFENINNTEVNSNLNQNSTFESQFEPINNSSEVVNHEMIPTNNIAPSNNQNVVNNDQNDNNLFNINDIINKNN